MRKILIVAAVTAAAALALAPVAGVAFADSSSTSTTEVVGVVKVADTSSFLRPTSSSMLVQKDIALDTKVLVTCRAEGQPVSGDPFWYRIANNGKLGFVPAGTVHLFNPKDITSCG